MIKFTHLLGVVALVCTGLLSSLASAGSDVDQDKVLELVRDGKIRPLAELMAQNPGRFNGHLLDVELEYERDVLVYEIEVLGQDGVVREFYLDPVTGEVLKEEIED